MFVSFIDLFEIGSIDSTFLLNVLISGFCFY